ncbi:hypothetical protein DPMN_087214 [Dreissena polymorpha]|uniref:Uncharacterized protein n=1 Tax=Dreissena polymorpha TaxID=45954 RepID=A0A9D4QVW8_DREPO|nr:hypothetical protein DPMN_087214 [Dreissena polymorpha]
MEDCDKVWAEAAQLITAERSGSVAGSCPMHACQGKRTSYLTKVGRNTPAQIRTRAVCKTCMPPIWDVCCSGSHCVNTFFATVTLTIDLVT